MRAAVFEGVHTAFAVAPRHAIDGLGASYAFPIVHLEPEVGKPYPVDRMRMQRACIDPSLLDFETLQRQFIEGSVEKRYLAGVAGHPVDDSFFSEAPISAEPGLLGTHDVDEAVLLSDRIVMMTNGPAATIGEVLRVELPRPRQRVALADNALYLNYRKAVIDFLYTRQSHVEKTAA